MQEVPQSDQHRRSATKLPAFIHVRMWNRADVCPATSHPLLVPSWRADSGDCVTEGEDRGCEERLGAGVLTDEATAEEAGVPAPGLVNGMLWLTECTGCGESTAPENKSRRRECFVCICTDNYTTQAIAIDFTTTTKTILEREMPSNKYLYKSWSFFYITHL